MSNEFSMDNPLNELGFISLHMQTLSKATAELAGNTGALAATSGRIAANAEQVSRDLQHGTEVFAPILAELTGEILRLRSDIQAGSKATARSSWTLVGATVALVFATLVMAWPMWFPRASVPLTTTAWVLWNERATGQGGKADYEVSTAYATRDECGIAVRNTAESFKKTNPTGKMYQANSSPYEVYVEYEPGSGIRFVCLPDTVDPREPKK